MKIKIRSVKDKEFEQYGRIIEGYDTTELIRCLNEKTVAPDDHVEYIPSVEALELTKAFNEYSESFYGGMPIQIGYCNGVNTKLNCLEYHRDSEVDVAATDCILLLARQQDCIDSTVDSSMVEAFLCPAGTAVELYATTLHYAPCSAKKKQPFKVGIVLPKGTNTEKPRIIVKNNEDKRLYARNKWLIAHPESPEVLNGAVIGITGENIDISNLI